MTLGRITFMEAVMRPFSWVNSSGRMMNLRTDSARETPRWLIDPLLHFGAHGGVPCRVLEGHVLVKPLGGEPRAQRLLVQRHQGGDERAFVTQHQRLGDELATLDDFLDRAGGDVLAAGSDDQILLAPGDVQEAIVVDTAKSPVAYQPSSVNDSSVASSFL